ncbi:hypothetical protein HPP92_022044 [Vanilla planifolia]|uniref:Peptidase S9A N-terminal domain-containing protein n=2 Tax=Vanilla planifolia TaxID=51239 RepID=A0A835PSP7_VANPL|nr:hypothetical protein HPP92_022044 [Vanilla planifolia]
METDFVQEDFCTLFHFHGGATGCEEGEARDEMFGDVRTDDYYWLRDDSRSDPEILSYLKEENDYTSQAMSGLITSETGISVYDVMPTGPGAPEEHIILDENIKAQVSPNNKLIAYAEDTKGNEIYSIYVIDADKENYHMDLGKLTSMTAKKQD